MWLSLLLFLPTSSSSPDLCRGGVGGGSGSEGPIQQARDLYTHKRKKEGGGIKERSSFPLFFTVRGFPLSISSFFSAAAAADGERKGEQRIYTYDLCTVWEGRISGTNDQKYKRFLPETVECAGKVAARCARGLSALSAALPLAVQLRRKFKCRFTIVTKYLGDCMCCVSLYLVRPLDRCAEEPPPRGEPGEAYRRTCFGMGNEKMF